MLESFYINKKVICSLKMSINIIKLQLKQHSLYETNTLKNINEEQQHSPEQNREAMYSSDLEFSSGEGFFLGTF